MDPIHDVLGVEDETFRDFCNSFIDNLRPHRHSVQLQQADIVDVQKRQDSQQRSDVEATHDTAMSVISFPRLQAPKCTPQLPAPIVSSAVDAPEVMRRPCEEKAQQAPTWMSDSRVDSSNHCGNPPPPTFSDVSIASQSRCAWRKSPSSTSSARTTLPDGEAKAKDPASTNFFECLMEGTELTEHHSGSSLDDDKCRPSQAIAHKSNKVARNNGAAGVHDFQPRELNLHLMNVATGRRRTGAQIFRSIPTLGLDFTVSLRKKTAKPIIVLLLEEEDETLAR